VAQLKLRFFIWLGRLSVDASVVVKSIINRDRPVLTSTPIVDLRAGHFSHMLVQLFSMLLLSDFLPLSLKVKSILNIHGFISSLKILLRAQVHITSLMVRAYFTFRCPDFSHLFFFQFESLALYLGLPSFFPSIQVLD